MAMQPDDMLADIPEVAGRKVLPPCVLLERLGRGGMGGVYRARHLNLAIDVAVKLMKPQLIADNPDFVVRFRREAQSAAAIRHQNVISVYDVSEHAGIHYIIMELVVGETARQRVQRCGPLPLDEALQIAVEAARGLGAAHALGIVHRDVKPDNLLIARSGAVKVADLGLAKLTLGASASMVSAANHVMGTASYMPPEQWESSEVGPTADVWALAATLYYLLAGADAFDARDGNYVRVMSQIVTKPFPDVRSKRADVPEEVAALLARASAKEPAARHADANEFAAAIEALGGKRTSLAFRAAPGEADTLMSPSPKELEQIKQWLREGGQQKTPTPWSKAAAPKPADDPLDAPTMPRPLPDPPSAGDDVATDGGKTVAAAADAASTPDSMATVASVSPAPSPLAAAPSPTTPSPTTPSSTTPARRGWMWFAAALVVGAVGYLIYPQLQSSPPPPPSPDPVAAVERLMQQADLDGAITAAKALREAQPSAAADRLLADALARRSRGARDNGTWRRALDDARESAALDASRQSERDELQRAIVAAANQGLAVVKPTGPVPKDAAVEVAVRIDVDAVLRLRSGGAWLARGADGLFAWTATVGPDGVVPLAAELADESQHELAPLTITFLSPPPPPQAMAITALAPIQPLVDGRAWTAGEVLVLKGRIDVGEARLFVGVGEQAKEVAGVVFADGEFSAPVPVAEEGRSTLTLTAKKDGHLDAVRTIDVLRLPSAPAFTIRQPQAAAAMATLATEVVVEGVSLGVAAITATVGGQSTALVRDDATATWSATLPLQPGPQAIVVAAKDLAGREATRQVEIDCAYAKARIVGMRWSAGAGSRDIERGEAVHVSADEGALEVAVEGPDVRLTRNGAPTPLRIPLRGKELQVPQGFRAANALPGGDEWVVQFVVDADAPSITVDRGSRAVEAAATDEVTLRGSWTDRIGVERVMVGEARAALVAESDGTKGAWSIRLPAPQTTRTLAVVAFDRAGNASKPATCQITLKAAAKAAATAATAAPTALEAIALPGFEAFGCPQGVAVRAGHPDVIVHKATRIELLAVRDGDGKPRRYVGRGPVTERQFDGTASDAAKVNVTGRNVRDWLLGAGKGFDLQTPAEWRELAGAAGFEALDRPPIEWLRPKSWADDYWPICKDRGGREEHLASDSLRFGFRVTFRVP